MTKSLTDQHWDKQAASNKDVSTVNIHDIYQREIENKYILKHLSKDEVVLEVGCGNGFTSNIIRDYVKELWSFDYSENMIERAKEAFGEKNNKFFHGNVLDLESLDKEFDTVICVRVLINLRNLEEQKKALKELTKHVKKGGKLILIEGFKDGFSALDEMRSTVGLKPLVPANINYYSYFSDIEEMLSTNYDKISEFTTGTYDFLTRVVYPVIAGEQNVSVNSHATEAIFKISDSCDIKGLEKFSRLKGFIFRKK